MHGLMQKLENCVLYVSQINQFIDTDASFIKY